MPQITPQVVLKCTGVLLTIGMSTVDSRSYISTGAFRNLDAKTNKNDTDPLEFGMAESLDGPSLTTYDQRQNGKYNIHVNIKDVKIIAVDGENLEGNLGDDTVYDYGDYDYDPAHLTVSPLPIFGSGPVSITSINKPAKSTTKGSILFTSSTKKPFLTTDSKPSSSTPSAITSTLNEGSIEGTSTQSSPTLEKEPNRNKPNPDTSSSNIIKIKPTPPQVQYDYQEIPVEVIVEPILRPKYRGIIQPPSHQRRSVSSRKHYVKQHTVEIVNANHQTQQRSAAIGCNGDEYRNKEGNCRARRKGLLTLFRLLSSFQEKND